MNRDMAVPVQGYGVPFQRGQSRSLGTGFGAVRTTGGGGTFNSFGWGGGNCVSGNMPPQGHGKTEKLQYGQSSQQKSTWKPKPRKSESCSGDTALSLTTYEMLKLHRTYLMNEIQETELMLSLYQQQQQQTEQRDSTSHNGSGAAGSVEHAIDKKRSMLETDDGTSATKKSRSEEQSQSEDQST